MPTCPIFTGPVTYFILKIGYWNTTITYKDEIESIKSCNDKHNVVKLLYDYNFLVHDTHIRTYILCLQVHLKQYCCDNSYYVLLYCLSGSYDVQVIVLILLKYFQWLSRAINSTTLLKLLLVSISFRVT